MIELTTEPTTSDIDNARELTPVTLANPAVKRIGGGTVSIGTVGNVPTRAATYVPFDERRLLRALMDLPEFARQVVPVVEAGCLFPEAAVIWTFIAESYLKHQTVPDFYALRVHNRRESEHTDTSEKAVEALIDELELMTPIHQTQMPILMQDTEAWVRQRTIHMRFRRILAALDSPTDDPRPLVDDLKAAFDWRFTDSATGRYVFKSRDTLLTSTMAAFLVQNLIVQNSLVALVSPPGSNKTFLALDLALSIASGQSTWVGEPLNLSGPVVYVLGEGGGRFKLRVQAWDQQHGITDTYPFYALDEAVALTRSIDAAAFVREVAALKPVLIVFDTLSRCLAGADENSQKDMSAAVGVCDTLRKQLGCCVLLLHHTTKDGSTERGSSVLRCAVDTLLVLKVPDASEPHFTMSCEKQKDAEPFAPIALMRESVTLASERDPHSGAPAMSCVVSVASAAHVSQHSDKRLWKAQRFMVAHPQGTKTALAEHLGGRKTETMREIAAWVSSGAIQFRRQRHRDPLMALKVEQTMTTAVQ